MSKPTIHVVATVPVDAHLTFRGPRFVSRKARAAAAAVLMVAGALADSGTAAAHENPGADLTLVVASAVSLSDVGTAASLVASGVGDAVVFAASSKELGVGSAAVVDRFGPSNVVVVGGTATLTGAIDDELRRLSANVGVQRLAGDDRIHTAALAAGRSERELETVVLANGWSLSDVGAAASVVATGGAHGVLYAHKDRLGDVTAEVLRSAQPQRVVIVGGTAALSREIEAELRDLVPGVKVERFGGATRIETAALSAERALTAGAQLLVVADGWSDSEVGIAAALAAAHGKAAVIYTRDGDDADPALKGLLQRHRPDRVLFVAAERTLGVKLMRRSQDTSRSSTFERITALRPQTPAEYAAVAAHYDFVDRTWAPPSGSVNPNPKTASEYLDENCEVESTRAHDAERTRFQYLFCRGDARSVDFSGVSFLAEARARGAKGFSGDGQITLSAGDYRDARFVGADLGGVAIAYGDFSWADFTDATFGGAQIGGYRGFGYVPDGVVPFIGARFGGADLRNTGLGDGCFAESDFSGAILRAEPTREEIEPGYVVVSGHDSPLREGRFTGAFFADADLSNSQLGGPMYSSETGLILPNTALTGDGIPIAAGSRRWEDIVWPMFHWDIDARSSTGTDWGGLQGVSFDAPTPEHLRTGRWCEALAGRWPLAGLTRVEEFFAANCELAIWSDFDSFDHERGRFDVEWPYLRCGGWGLDFSGTDFSGVDFGEEARRRGGVGPDGRGLLVFVGHSTYAGADFSGSSLRNVHFLDYDDGDNSQSVSPHWAGFAASARTGTRGFFPDDFTDANFREAQFRPQARLSGIFNGANFRDTDLSGMWLGLLNPSCFEGADFSGANLEDAIILENIADGAMFRDSNDGGFRMSNPPTGWINAARRNPDLRSALRRWCPSATS